jgi:hypothetical protein
MSIHDRLRNRFNQLRELMEAIPGEESELYGVAWHQFVTSAHNLILEVFGVESVHYRVFEGMSEFNVGANLIMRLKASF